ncbi:uncharacterized protein LOC105939996 [Fundulus heteroclitus]|uniref:uncharacterized protein LOC105939996 n=1 Tax=Fundulus heteroclitus TaxID=8078 RepID=UPI00165BA7D5|nr:uncharacterized protein LOC105939996 [Fundulus heteroclitus]
MVENRFTKPLGLVLIVAAHMVFCGLSHVRVIGIVDQNISLNFTFNTTIRNNSSIAVYKCISKQQKISEYPHCKSEIEVYPEFSSVIFHLTNLSLNNTETYWATLFRNGKTETSNKVELIVQEDNRRTSVPPVPSTFTQTTTSGSSSFLSSNVVTVIVVSPFLVLAAILPFLVICLAKPKGPTQEASQRTSNPPAQETLEVSVNSTGSSLVYSVLDFPKRPPSTVEFSPNNTEYASVSYLPEKKPRSHTNK